jgi:hypothetical protein
MVMAESCSGECGPETGLGGNPLKTIHGIVWEFNHSMTISLV